MKRVYIDFDSTLYDTGAIKTVMNDIIADGVCKNVPGAVKEDVLEEVKEAKTNGIKSVFGLCKFFEEKYGLKKNSIRSDFEDYLAKGEALLYSDTIPFLKKLAQKDYEINMLTYTSQDSYDYQMVKLMGATICDYFENIFICTQKKGTLGLDYKNGIFIDDNPKELVSLYNAGVSADRLLRIRREGAGYSAIEITEFEAREYKDFTDIGL